MVDYSKISTDRLKAEILYWACSSNYHAGIDEHLGMLMDDYTRKTGIAFGQKERVTTGT